MGVGELAAFAAINLVITMVPGIDTALVMRNSVKYGTRYGVLTALGTSTGQIIQASAAALGLSAILLQSALAFEIVKYLGAAYLVVLGVLALLASRKKRGAPAASEAEDEAPVVAPSAVRVVGLGVLTSLTNPKVALFWLSILPQFADVGGGPTAMLPQALLLGLISFANGALWMSLVATLIGRVAAFLRRPRVRRIQERVIGGIFIGLGVRLAVEKAP
ncbi:LysE family translocator [Tenggerimyces flavus]|uniref:LysE family translocator n=1 Tax=Tenggerimyces flavus TaxID=1708749 RepID=A0ABV7YEM1_9ACTN|nr:LysE family translocator [Tenggerimyces flavus]MBM7788937.1 threonine/homoserine/homoserine lactone efflux protein [Tenggerimyces flavus]